jgi:hypothetical protein
MHRTLQNMVGFVAASMLALGSTVASATPITLIDSNGTRYKVNTEVSPFLTDSLASGAVTNATFTAPVQVTSYFQFETFFGGTSTATVKYDVNSDLTPAFLGFNGLLISSLNGATLPSPLVFNPAQPATPDCPNSDGSNRDLVFQTQTFGASNLTLTRKVFVPHNHPWVRWLNIITNTGANATQVGITLRGLIASANQTKIVATSTGGSLGATALWFTSAQTVPQGEHSSEPRIGYVLQGPGAATPASSVGINVGAAAFTYTPTIPAGGTVIVMTFVTVQGKSSTAKSTVEDLVATPLPAQAITCMSELELSQVVNFAKVTPPTLKSATVKLNFKTTGVDTVQWKGKVTIGAGISLQGLPVTVNFGGVTQSFVLAKNGSANDGGGNKFNLPAKLANGVTKAGTVNFSFNLKGDLQTALAAYGLTNATASNVPVTIPVTFAVGSAGAGYGVNQAFTWNATQNKSGTGKAS